MGAAPSHLGQAEAGAWSPAFAGSPGGDAALSEGEATAGGIAQIPIAGGRYLGTKGHLKGVSDSYGTGTGSVGRGGPPLGDNSAFASGVSAGVAAEPHPSRGRMSPGESAGARLTVSPSMKVPQESPVPTQAGGHVVPSVPGRQASFGQGQAGAYGG
jgi:hypothetical protein